VGWPSKKYNGLTRCWAGHGPGWLQHVAPPVLIPLPPISEEDEIKHLPSIQLIIMLENGLTWESYINKMLYKTFILFQIYLLDILE
jgi:hypothetical protein